MGHFKNIRALSFSALSAVFFFCAGCSTIKQPSEVFVVPDYTEQDVLEHEKRRIAELSERNPVEALWRAGLLGDEAVSAQYAEAVYALLEKAVSESDFASAVRYYQSLEAAGFSGVKNLPLSKRQLFSEYLKNVPGLSVDEQLLPKTITDCVNATVTIWVDRGIRIQNGAGYADRVIGSGFFIDRRGYIVTNHHVISDLVDPKYEGYSRLFVKLARDAETRIPAKVVGYDALIDLALLKVEVDPPFVLALGSSAELAVGDKVSAIGTPLGLYGTITSGIVSSVDRKLFTTGSVLQIDAAVNSGNSGGPCIDSRMRVQAVVFAGILQYQGLNFAIPVEYLRQDLPYLYAGGRRSHVWIGAYGHTMKEGLKEVGLEVQYVMPGGVACRAGIEAGDVLTFVDGRRVYSLEDVQDVFRNFAPETIVSCSYTREGEARNALLYLDERPEQPGYEMYCSDLLSSSFIPIFGMGLAPASTLSSRRYVISKIIKGSIADESGFSETDPVYVAGVDFNEDKSAISAALSTRNKKKGYLDISIRIGSALDGPYYF
ncbi:MAG: S1C family serine protease [Treponemataceae bacterium]|nr:S1C family serine protease [Treponemataceae bacterium]